MPTQDHDPFLIDAHKLQFHPERIAQYQKDPLHTYPIYVEISPVGHCNHRCLTGDTPVNTIDGPIAIKDLVGRISVPVYTYSPTSKEVFITNAINIRLVGKMEDVVRVFFTDGTHLDCTPDHKLLQIGLGRFKRGEAPKEAEHFKNGDRVRALRVNYNEHGYADVVWGRYGKRKRYRLIMDYLRGYKLSRKEQVHHIDRNKGNDTVSNLQYCASAREHTLLHPEITARMSANNPAKSMTPEWRERLRKAVTGKKRSLEQRLRYRASKLGVKNPNYKGLPETGRTRIKEINHVVYKVERIPRQDVYCLEVPATGWFFANDVLVANCSFCAVDYIGYKARSIDVPTMSMALQSMAENGVKSIMFAGEGEPLLHKNIDRFVSDAHGFGLDVAFTTNGVLLDKLFPVLDKIKWIKVSLNAGDKETYAKVHQTKEADWDRVWGNLSSARKIQPKGTAMGIQCVVLPDNISSLPSLVQMAKEIGLDYVVLKPYSQHKSSDSKRYAELTYDKAVVDTFKELEAQSTPETQIIARTNAISSWNSGAHEYNKCLSTPFFWAYVMATGDVYSCSAYLLDDRFNMGNINTHSFKDIWEGPKRENHIEFMKTLDISGCRLNCRMNQVNKYLDMLERSNLHKNFI